jgi:hypothetical protein
LAAARGEELSMLRNSPKITKTATIPPSCIFASTCSDAIRVPDYSRDGEGGLDDSAVRNKLKM